MKNSRRFLISGAVVILRIAAVPLLRADFGRHGHGRHGFGVLGRLGALSQQLGLTDTQVTQIKAIAKDLRTQNEPYRTQLRGGFHGIAQTLLANPNDLAAAQTQLDAQNVAEKAMKTNALTAASKALNVLTPEQRTRLAAILAKHQAEHQAAHQAEQD
jgi:Spy/CpxP family protein refolding chaperone